MIKPQYSTRRLIFITQADLKHAFAAEVLRLGAEIMSAVTPGIAAK